MTMAASKQAAVDGLDWVTVGVEVQAAIKIEVAPKTAHSRLTPG